MKKLTAVLLLQSYGPYNGGEIAGFPDDQALAMIERGIAAFPEETMPTSVGDSSTDPAADTDDSGGAAPSGTSTPEGAGQTAGDPAAVSATVDETNKEGTGDVSHEQKAGDAGAKQDAPATSGTTKAVGAPPVDKMIDKTDTETKTSRGPTR